MDKHNRPSLLVLTSTFPRWEGDHEPPFVFELARRLTDRFEVTVLAPHAPGALHRETMDGVQVRRFRYAPDRFEQLAYNGGIPANLKNTPWLGILVPSFVLAQLFVAFRLTRSLRPAAVHGHWLIPGGLIGALVAGRKGDRVRLLVTAHGGDIYSLGSPLSRWLKRWVLRRANRVTVVSHALAAMAEAQGATPGQISVLPMGTDLTRLFVPLPRQSSTSRIVYAGRLVEKKGVDTLLRAVAALSQNLPELKLQIAGHGPSRQALETLSNELGIQSNTLFSGPYSITALPQIYADADLAVFPFRAAGGGDQDGFGLAVVEAMGCGIPVLGSDIAPLDDLLVHGVDSLRAPADDPEAFAAAIRLSLSDPQAARLRAQTAREKVVNNFDWTPIAAKYADLLDREIT